MQMVMGWEIDMFICWGSYFYYFSFFFFLFYNFRERPPYVTDLDASPPPCPPKYPKILGCLYTSPLCVSPLPCPPVPEIWWNTKNKIRRASQEDFLQEESYWMLFIIKKGEILNKFQRKLKNMDFNVEKKEKFPITLIRNVAILFKIINQ